MVGKTLQKKAGPLQTNGMGFGDGQGHGRCGALQGFFAEILRLSRQDVAVKVETAQELE